MSHWSGGVDHLRLVIPFGPIGLVIGTDGPFTESDSSTTLRKKMNNWKEQ